MTDQLKVKDPESPATDKNDHAKDYVTVTINGAAKQIHRGNHTVTELKALLGVDTAQELDEVLHGEFQPLDEGGRITIKGNELFVSHARRGGSS